MNLIWLRHGETDWNTAGCYLGHFDAPLNERGKLQAQVIAEQLTRYAIVRIYTSDLSRCMETARIVAERTGTSLLWSKALRELDFGEWDGKTYEQIQSMDGKRVTDWYSNPFALAPPGGESLSEMGQRLDEWFQKLEAVDRSGMTLIVTHGGPIRWFQSRWVLGDASRFWDVEGLSHAEALLAKWTGQTWSLQKIGKQENT